MTCVFSFKFFEQRNSDSVVQDLIVCRRHASADGFLIAF